MSNVEITIDPEFQSLAATDFCGYLANDSVASVVHQNQFGK